jgi:hypothetical protein
MRLPGTFNPNGHNNLITLPYYKSLKTAQATLEAEKAAGHDPGPATPKRKMARSKPQAPDAAADAAPAAEESKKDDEPKKNDTPAAAEWTTEQDATLLKTKLEEKKSWKAIAAALGKPVGDVKKRWGEIRPKDGSGPRKNGEAKDTEEKKIDASREEANTKKERRHEAIAKAISVLSAGSSGFDLRPDEKWSDQEVSLISCICRSL